MGCCSSQASEPKHVENVEQIDAFDPKKIAQGLPLSTRNLYAGHYRQVLRDQFQCVESEIFFADSKESSLQPDDLQRMAKSFLKVMDRLGKTQSPPSPARQVFALEAMTTRFFATLEAAMIKHSAAVEFDKAFEESRKATKENLEKKDDSTDQNAIAALAEKSWRDTWSGDGGSRLTSFVSTFVADTTGLPIFGVINTGHRREDIHGEIFLKEKAIQHSRMVLLSGLHDVATNIHSTICSSVFDRFCSDIMPPGNHDAMAQFTALLLAECAGMPSLGEQYSVSPFTVGKRCKEPSDFFPEYQRWLDVSLCDLRDFSDVKVFPWFLTGYHLAAAEQHFVAAMLGSQMEHSLPAPSSSPAITNPIVIWNNDVQIPNVDMTDELGNVTQIPNNTQAHLLEVLEDTVKVLHNGTIGSVQASNVEPPPAQNMSLETFPSCSAVLRKFADDHVDVWVRKVSDATTHTDFCRFKLDSILSAAQETAKTLSDSNLFSTKNPFGLQLCELSFSMAVQLMVEYTVGKDATREAQFKWTPFGEMVKEKTAAAVQELKANAAYLENCGDKITADNLSDMVKTMTKIRNIVEGMGGGPAQSKTGEISQLSEKLRKLHTAASTSVASCRYALESPPSKRQVYVCGFGSVDLTDVTKHFNDTSFQRTQVGQQSDACKNAWRVVIDEVKMYLPRVLIVVRSPEQETSDPDSDEKSFLSAINTEVPSVGVIVWIWPNSSGQKLDAQKWERTGVSEKKCPGIKTLAIDGTQWILPPAGSTNPAKVRLPKDAGVKVLHRVFELAESCKDSRVAYANGKLKSVRDDYRTHIKDFVTKRALEREKTPEQFYTEIVAKQKVDRERLRAGAQDAGHGEARVTLTLPDRTMLNFHPFLDEIAQMAVNGEYVQQVNELQTRTFLKTALRAQIQHHGKLVAAELYKSSVSAMLLGYVCNQFSLTLERFEELMREFLNPAAGEEEGERPSSAEATCAKAAAFLLPENFTTMYVGGTVLMCAPLLDSMIGSCLGGEHGKEHPSRSQYDENMRKARNHYKNMFLQYQRTKLCQLQPLPDGADRLEVMTTRLNSVKTCLQSMFTEADVMRNLVYEVQQLMHTVLQPVQHRDILYLFKCRLRQIYWQSGRDELIKLEPTTDFAAVTQSFMSMTQLIAARKQSIASELRGSHKLFAIAPFFQAFKKKERRHCGESEPAPINAELRMESMSFLSQLFDFVSAFSEPSLEDYAGMGFASVKEDMNKEGLTEDVILNFKQQVGCAHMSLKMMGETEVQPPVGRSSASSGDDQDHIQLKKDRLIRPSFVGTESVGKSTFINFLVDPSQRRSALVVAEGMGTQTMTVVKHSDCEEIYMDGNRKPSAKSAKDMNTEMVNIGLEAQKDRASKESLDRPVFMRTTPFEMDMAKHMNLEMVDVPGMKPEVELETALALGVSTALVICVTDCTSFSTACETGNLKPLKALYHGLPLPRPPIVVAISKQKDKGNTRHHYDSDSFIMLEDEQLPADPVGIAPTKQKKSGM